MDSEKEPSMPDADTLKALPRVRKARAPKKAKKSKRLVAKKTKAKVTKKAKRPAAKKPKAKRPASKATVERCERLELRLTKAEKNNLFARATKLRRTMTSVALEAIQKIK